MNSPDTTARKTRADVLRSGATLLDRAQRHSLQHGIGTSPDAIARELGVRPGMLCRHFPTREALPAAVLQTDSAELTQQRVAAGAGGRFQSGQCPPRTSDDGGAGQ